MRFILVVSLVLALIPAAFGAERPDLVVVISVDQFPHAYLERFGPWFGEGGFRRFLDSGADFPNARYPYAITFTAAGHAAIGTGRTPAETGIVANSWFDRLAGRPLNAAEDSRVKPLAGSSTGVSPIRLLSDSLGDRLKESSPGSKVISIALKDDASTLMGGRKADAAYWFNDAIPGFNSSTYYRANPDVLAYNAKIPSLLSQHASWTQSTIIPKADLEKITFDPPSLREHKSTRPGLGKSFPHPITNADSFVHTPFAHDMTLDFARHVIAVEQLGTRAGRPDILYLGLSAIDNLGHLFGPDSLEIADAVVRLDRSLATFFDDLAKSPGTRITVALTADHGVQAIPEVARARGRDAGRVDFYNRKNAKTIADLSLDRRLVEKFASAKLGIPFDATVPLEKALVQWFERPSLYVNWPRVRQLKLDPERVRAALRDATLKVTGVRAAYTSSELLAPNPSADPLERSVRYSFHPDRSGDVLVILKEGWVWGAKNGTGAYHGQPVDADQRVPVMVWGHGIRKGSYADVATPLDLAKSLGSLLGVDAGGAETVVLPCIEK